MKIRPPAINKARVLVHNIRKQWLKWEIDQDEDPEEDVCCCWVTKEHVEAFIYWAILCCARKSSGRKNISYSKYKPLSTEGSEHGSVGNAEDPGVELIDPRIERSDALQLTDVDLERSYWQSSNVLQRMTSNWLG